MQATEGEIRKRPAINWAKVVRDPGTGDFYGEGLGITAIGIGSNLTEAKLYGQSVVLRSRQVVGVEESFTRIYVGKLDWEKRMIKIGFRQDSPISMEDTGV